VYFNTSASTPQTSPTNNPEALLVCAVNVGNAYPVIEDPSGPASLRKTVCKTGYQSHYAVGNGSSFSSSFSPKLAFDALSFFQ